MTTTTITHATPGGCYAHTPERNWEVDAKLSPEARAAGFPDIARQLVEFSHGDGLEVALRRRTRVLPAPSAPSASGERLDGRDLTAEWQKRFAGGPTSRRARRCSRSIRRRRATLLGLFAPSHLKFESDARREGADGEPSLAEMTAAALDILARSPKGFVLMVEGGRIDHGHHAGNAYRALTETIEFADAVQLALASDQPEGHA